jgi:hypothetical protein
MNRPVPAGVLASHPGQGIRAIVVTRTNGELGVP